MSYSVLMTDTAKQDLREIAYWIADKTKDIKPAKRFVIELRESCRTLDMFPGSGAIPRDRVLMSLGYRYIVHKEYLIFYLIDEEKKTVQIMAIFNARKDYMRVLGRLI